MKIINEIEIWKSARLTISHFGDRARARAQMRAEECKQRSDIDGWVMWMRIAATIIELENSASQSAASPSAGTNK
ncbi:MAG: hypothetical protein R3D05_03140 [Dongiaceae bacterium]